MNYDDDQTKYLIAPYVRVGIRQNKLSLGYGSLQRKIDEVRLFKPFLEAFSLWRQATTFRSIRDHLAKDYSNDDIRYVLSTIRKGRYLIKEGKYDRSDRYSRHALFYCLNGQDSEKLQSVLKNKHVIILGCGGIGSIMSVSLAVAGIGRLTLVDNDCIEVSNLTRQILYSEADVGNSKLLVLKNKILAVRSDIEANTITQRTTSSNLSRLPEADLIILSADSPGCAFWANKHAVQTRTPFINIGYVEDIAVWGPFVIPYETGCYACQSIESDTQGIADHYQDLIQAINRQYQAPSTGPVNLMACSHGLLDVIKFLGGFGKIHSLNKRIGIWTHDLKIEEQSCKKNPNCRVCGVNP